MTEAKAETKEKATFTTSRLNVIAWMQIHQIKTVSYKRIGPTKMEYVFDDSEGKCEELYAVWLNSVTCIFDNRVRELKRQFFRRKNGDLRDRE